MARPTETSKLSRIPFFGSFSNREASGSKDQRYVNCFPESRKFEQEESTKFYLMKRAGISSVASVGATAEGRGAAYFNGKHYVAVGQVLYSITGAGVVATVIANIGSSTGYVGMTRG